MFIKMKLTKKKLEQLILQEMRYFRPPEFDPRAEKSYPEHATKLSDRYIDDPSHAFSLADSLDDPIDVEAPETDKEDMVFDIDRSKQFRQRSRSSAYGALVEIWFDGEDNIWNVDVLKRDQMMGMPVWTHTRYSKEFEGMQGKEAIEHYNKFADVPYEVGPDLEKNTDYAPHPNNPYRKP